MRRTKFALATICIAGTLFGASAACAGAGGGGAAGAGFGGWMADSYNNAPPAVGPAWDEGRLYNRHALKRHWHRHSRHDH
jgi:hypothetical protein